MRPEGGFGRPAAEEGHGGTFNQSVAQDGARQHNGHNYNNVTNNYHNSSPQRAPAADDMSRQSIAEAMDALNFARVDARRNNISKEHRNTC